MDLLSDISLQLAIALVIYIIAIVLGIFKVQTEDADE